MLYPACSGVGRPHAGGWRTVEWRNSTPQYVSSFLAVCLFVFVSGAQPTLKAGNAPVAPLVLHGVVGGGDHLPTGGPYASWPCLLYRRKLCPQVQWVTTKNINDVISTIAFLDKWTIQHKNNFRFEPVTIAINEF